MVATHPAWVAAIFLRKTWGIEKAWPQGQA